MLVLNQAGGNWVGPLSENSGAESLHAKLDFFKVPGQLTDWLTSFRLHQTDVQ